MSPDSRDPYKAVRKQPDCDGSTKYEQEDFSSESSITYLTTKQHKEYDYVQDPYNRQRNKAYMESEKRANSYLPYSNHNRNPNRPAEPIYLDEDLPSFRQPGQYGPVGSILQDNIVMDMMEQDGLNSSNLPLRKNINASMQPFENAKKKRWWTRLGISGRKVVFVMFSFIVFVVLAWYFVWPRVPTLQYVGAYLDDNPTMTNVSMEAVWKVNFTVLNQDNWIPTNIQNLAVSVFDANTGVTFGRGNSNQLTLRPRSIDQAVTIPIHINYTASNPNDPTFQDLSSSCSIVNQDLSSPPKETFDIKFKIVYYIAGIIWHTAAIVAPTTTYFQCPTNTE
ncbi:hypothetical protein G6F37_004353 [Rhizopus arrhizus]|nr:hypothetical protein G6F38_002941 [Rhizopus arrhizus]KAG1160029.1 hypothetical protein G6F37_004353 [Rhizopus arrhizus]